MNNYKLVSTQCRVLVGITLFSCYLKARKENNYQ